MSQGLPLKTWLDDGVSSKAFPAIQVILSRNLENPNQEETSDNKPHVLRHAIVTTAISHLIQKVHLHYA